jgi:hypothetical protein
MPAKEMPFGYKVESRNLAGHMPRKEIVREHLPAPVVNVVKCAYEVTFERDEHGRIKSPIRIKPI